MPRRKKAPPQDMDLDSDEDNAISKQKKATEKFMALLKPIKDAALAFDVDVDEALEDYVEACVRYVEKDAGAMINFAEAGLLLQGSAVVYGRKVDGVHALVYRVLELLRTGQKEKEKAEKKAAVRSRRPVVLWCLHAIDATRVHLTMKWVVSFSDRVETAMPRAGRSERGGGVRRGGAARPPAGERATTLETVPRGQEHRPRRGQGKGDRAVRRRSVGGDAVSRYR